MLRRLRVRLHRLVHREPVHDIVTRTEREARLDEIDARSRRYLRTVLPALALLMTGLVAPLPVPVRAAALVLAALLAPFALGATLPRR